MICYSRDPHKQNELISITKNHSRLRVILGDIRDKERLFLAAHGCDTIIHTAALKHVDAGEYNPVEFVKTNIDGTLNVASAATELGIEKALFVSTDKAVSAFNLYGRTKAVAERVWIRENIYGRGTTKLSAIRYGNVFDSHGSVMEAWSNKKYGDDITVRIPNPTRFVCFLSWGVEWIRKALDMMRGGEIFVPSNLNAISMVSLAEEIVGWYHVSMIPLNAGEKQHEMLISPEEYQSTVEHAGFYIVNPEEPQWKYDNWKGKYAEPMMYTSELTKYIKAKDFIKLYKETAGDWKKWC